MSLDLLLERFGGVVQTPQDVEKLNELILQWAVQGKLVPQEPTDEPASELLKRIEIEKIKLVKAKKIRKEKKLTSISDDELPFELPSTWEWVRMGNLCYQITDGTHHTPKYVDAGVPFLSVKDISGGFLDFSNTRFISPEEHATLTKRCNPEYGDILLTKVGTTGIAVVNDSDLDFSIFVSVALLKFNQDEMLPEYLERLINSPLVRSKSAKNTRGVGNKNLVLRDIKNFAIPIPPKAEQKRIVAKVEELLGQTRRLAEDLQTAENARRRWHTATLHQLTSPSQNGSLPAVWHLLTANFDALYREPETIAELKQAILQLAVQGRLVAQDPNDEPASELLKRIEQKRKLLTKSKKIRKLKPMPLIKTKDMPYNVPSGWVWERFGRISFNRDGERVPLSRSVRKTRQGEFDYYGASGVIDKIDDYLFDKPLLLIGEDGANLINRSTPIAFIAKGKYWVNNHAHVIDGVEFALIDYLRVFINAISLEPYITGTAQPKMNQAKLNFIPIALPPLAEQKRIAVKVKELFGLCNQLANDATAAETARLRLRDALFATASSP